MAQTDQFRVHDYPFLKGGDEMGKLIMSIDWSSTLGAPETWPQALKQTISMMLNTPFPMLICWGKNYIQFYNDAFRPILGATKHPRAMGISVSETFAEIWDTIGPMFAQVMNGKPIGFPDFMVPLDRNGYFEDCYFDFSYSPIRDEQGHIGGVLVICTETTEKVKALEDVERARRKIELAQAETIIERDRLKRFFMQAPAGICILEGPDFVFDLINPLYQQLFPGRGLLGKPLLDALPELKDQVIWNILQEVYHTGKTFEGNELLVPLARTTDGPVEDRYFNFIYQARKDKNGAVDGIMVFVIEVTEIVMTKHLIEKSEERFKFILNAIPQQVWTAKPDGAVDYVNQVVRDDFGIRGGEIVEKGWQTFVHPDDLTDVLKKWFRSLETGEEYAVELRLLFKDGHYRWHLSRAIPFVDNGQIKSWLGTNTNIEIQKSNEQKKDEFLSIASHELKTPLTSIKAFNQIMARTGDPEKQMNFIKKSTAHISRLERLIDDLLDVTKINAGKMNYTMGQFNFGQMLIESIESLQYSASHEIILESIVDVTFTGDHYRLEQVMNNFLTNAIKYSPPGTKILVNSKVEQGNILVSVQDFGIGIEPQNLDKLFDRYYRVDNTGMRFDGLGLGLFISAEILKRHRGDFWIESEPDQGSTFYFRLPLQDKKHEAVAKSNTFYKDSTITIAYNHAYNRLDVDWTGYQDIESVKDGCLMMLEYLVKNKTDRVVNDNTHVLGNWSEAVEWVGNIWFPMMEKAGLKYLAHIFSPNTFSQLSAKKSVDIMAGIVTTQYFTDITLAQQWVNSQPTLIQ
jgi:PAS domain S-box-containing protein